MSVNVTGVGPQATVHIHVAGNTDGLAAREYVDRRFGEMEAGKLDREQGAEHAGKILGIGADGTVILLALGAGLEIRGGMLTVTDERSAAPVCGEALCGEAKCGEV